MTQWIIPAVNKHTAAFLGMQPVADKAGQGSAHAAGTPQGTLGIGTHV